MNVYLLEIYNEKGQLANEWNGMVWTTMVGACKYGERIHRRFGYTYRVLRCNVMQNKPYSIF